ncbi:MAG: hypothetical protein EAZ43_14000 [Betaproteobacteria bacterium]|nr:MAG: hypothetical protein EAZ43_14000 [Betaproteobacteria bacterium]
MNPRATAFAAFVDRRIDATVIRHAALYDPAPTAADTGRDIRPTAARLTHFASSISALFRR